MIDRSRFVDLRKRVYWLDTNAGTALVAGTALLSLLLLTRVGIAAFLLMVAFAVVVLFVVMPGFRLSRSRPSNDL